MSLELLKKSRWLAIASMLALSTTAVGCAADSTGSSEEEEEGASTDDITQVNQAKVKRQSIGNCWIYAMHSWAEALNKGATGQEMNLSETYMTYWHWFDQIVNGSVSGELSTGGSYSTAAGLIDRYGMIPEATFIPSEAEAEMSSTQSSALSTINASLKSGELADPAVRRDRKKVRAALDKAFNLRPEMVEALNKTFGEGVTRTLDRSYKSRKPYGGILRAKDIPARMKDPTTGQIGKGTLQDALGAGSWWRREGKFAWQEADYPYDAAGRRAFEVRVQKALHDGFPVIISWKVDFNALTSKAEFSLDELKRRGPGRQGGHMTVLHDYQAEVPGLGLLKAGEQATPDAMQKALSNDTKVVFFRTKNSWGGIRPDRWSEAAIPGYHELMNAYMQGPIKECAEKNGTSDPTNCPRDVTPWWDAVLPAGY
ncbi:MAG: hypothetical protein JNL38_25660 [Myxococcales bacterium]|jgi:hypothetical protein|nr:hypothetical protein [Myxococcales bacterium]